MLASTLNRHGRPLRRPLHPCHRPWCISLACLGPVLTPERTLIGKSGHGSGSVVDVHLGFMLVNQNLLRNFRIWISKRSFAVVGHNRKQLHALFGSSGRSARLLHTRPSWRLNFQQSFGNGRAFWLRLIKFDPHAARRLGRH